MNYISGKDNTRLYVKDCGCVEPVILIHGWPLLADNNTSVIKTLFNTRSVHLPM